MDDSDSSGWSATERSPRKRHRARHAKAAPDSYPEDDRENGELEPSAQAPWLWGDPTAPVNGDRRSGDRPTGRMSGDARGAGDPIVLNDPRGGDVRGPGGWRDAAGGETDTAAVPVVQPNGPPAPGLPPVSGAPPRSGPAPAPDASEHGGAGDTDATAQFDAVGQHYPTGQLDTTGQLDMTGQSERSGPADPADRTGELAQQSGEPGGRSGSSSKEAGSLDDGEPSKSARAGRNLPAAIGVGVSLGIVVVAGLVLWRPAFLVIIVAAVSLGIWEMSRAIRSSGAKPPVTPLLVGGAAMSVLAWFSGPSALTIGLLLTVLATMVWRIADGPPGYLRDTAAAQLIAVYVPFLGGFAALLAAPDDGATRVLVALVAVVVSDTGGYATGVFFGRHPMAPSVSPKKTWEGLAGSLAATAVAGAIGLAIFLDVAWWWGLLFGIAVSAASVLGDLAESLIKRDLGVKDMGTLLPGHGGMMDRLDSILFAAPTAYVLLSVLAPASS